MSIEKQGRERIIVCDSCDDNYQAFDQDDFQTMIAAAKGDGWDIRPGGEHSYTHRCPDCAGANETPLQRAKRLLG